MHSIFFKPHNLTQKNPREQIQKSVMLNYGQTAEKRKKKLPSGIGPAQPKKGLIQAKSAVYTG
jgi:hypothetical protein